MKAEEMFENLGFWSRKRNDTEIVWTRKVREDFIEKEIIFNLVVAKVSIEGGWLTKEELQAVSKQCEELGWFGSEQNQETNLDHFKHEILEDCVWNLAVVKGRPKPCNRTNCHDCEFYDDNATECYKRAAEWLKQPCTKSTCELTQFEYDLLQSFLKVHPSRYQFKNISALTEMRKKGYFKGVDRDAALEDILVNCEITEEE